MKGVTQLVGAVILILIAIIGTTGVLMWTQRTTGNYRNQSEHQIDEKIKSSEASFAIYDVSGDKITIKNIGKTELKVDSFKVYENQNKRSITSTNPSVTTLSPGDEITLKVSGGSLTGDITVTGQYGLTDGGDVSSW